VKSFLNRFATPLTAGLFAVSAFSGIALFFHVASGAFHEMHEWLSMVLLLPFAFHLSRNWTALLGYARRGVLLLPVAATLVAAALFVVPALVSGQMGGGEPPFRAMQLMTETDLADLAPVLKTTPASLLSGLRLRGYKVASTKETLDSVATASGISAVQLLFELLPAK